jgi:hypothetical protein
MMPASPFEIARSYGFDDEPVFGLGDVQSDVAQAQALLQAGSAIDFDTLLTVQGLTPQNVADMATQAGTQLAAQGIGAAVDRWNQTQTPQANQARIDAGVSAGSSILASGYNPDNPDDNQKMIVAIAGGISLVPGIGPVLGGAILLLDGVGQAIAPVLYSIGLISKPGCSSSGNWTAATVLSTTRAMLGQWGTMPPAPVGSFSDFALGLLATDNAQSANCKPHMGNFSTLAAAAAIWNANATGPVQLIYVPSLVLQGGGASIGFADPGQVAHAFQPVSADFAAKFASEDPSIFSLAQGWTSPPWNQGVGGERPLILKLAGSSYTPPSAAGAAAAQAAAQAIAQQAAAPSTGTPPSAPSAAPVVATVVVGGLGAALWFYLGRPMSAHAFELAWSHLMSRR